MFVKSFFNWRNAPGARFQVSLSGQAGATRCRAASAVSTESGRGTRNTFTLAPLPDAANSAGRASTGGGLAGRSPRVNQSSHANTVLCRPAPLQAHALRLPACCLARCAGCSRLR
jgi:hypothetical protein